MNKSGSDPDAARAALEAERADLLSASDEAKGERAPVALDQQSVGRLSRMDAMQVQAMAKAVDERRQARLRLIDMALKRLDSGDYGYCVNCEEPIPAKRLAIDPAVARCVECAD